MRAANFPTVKPPASLAAQIPISRIIGGHKTWNQRQQVHEQDRDRPLRNRVDRRQLQSSQEVLFHTETVDREHRGDQQCGQVPRPASLKECGHVGCVKETGERICPLQQGQHCGLGRHVPLYLFASYIEQNLVLVSQGTSYQMDRVTHEEQETEKERDLADEVPDAECKI